MFGAHFLIIESSIFSIVAMLIVEMLYTLFLANDAVLQAENWSILSILTKNVSVNLQKEFSI